MCSKKSGVDCRFSPRQQRGSDDCGVYMVAHFIADYLKVKIADAFTLPSRLRPLLVKISKSKTHKADALIMIRDILLHKRYNNFIRTKINNEIDPYKELKDDVNIDNVAQEMLGGSDGVQMKEKCKPVKRIVRIRPHNTTHQRNAEADKKINTCVENVVRQARLYERNAAQNNLCYMLVATILASARDGVQRSLSPSYLYYLRWKCGFMRGHRDVAETLTALQQPLAAITRDKVDNTSLLLELTPNALEHEQLFIQTNQGAGFPQNIANLTFILGAAFIGTITENGAYHGHYKLTQNASKAVVGLYCKDNEEEIRDEAENKDEHTANNTKRDDINAIENTLQQADSTSQQQKHNVISNNKNTTTECLWSKPDDLKNVALYSAPQLHLNGWGRRPWDHVCPRTWYVYSGKPPHVTQMAWNAITPQTRQQHLRWINEIRAMPDDLLNVSFPTALLELVRRMAVARKWKWSTISKIYANIKAALLKLAMHTNQLQPIKLDEHPEWRAGMATALRYNRETPATTFAPATLR